MSSLPRRLAFLFLALFTTAITVMFVQQYLRGVAAPQTAAGAAVGADSTPIEPPTQILVAKGDIAPGSLLSAENLQWQVWPRTGLNDSYVQQGKAKLEDFVGAVARSRVTSGEPITAARVVRPGDRSLMAAVLNPGMRAVTVNVTPATGMGGFALPGDHVDLILTMVMHPDKDKKDDPDRHISKTVLTDIRVLAIDQKLSDDKKEVSVPKTATLEVTPRQAEVVAVTTELGLLSLSLRGVIEDEYPASGRPTWDYEATGLPLNLPHVVVARKVTVVRGSDRSEVELSGANQGARKP